MELISLGLLYFMQIWIPKTKTQRSADSTIITVIDFLKNLCNHSKLLSLYDRATIIVN